MMSRAYAKAQGTQHGGADRRPHTAAFTISALSVAGDMRDWGNLPCDVMRRNFVGPMAMVEENMMACAPQGAAGSKTPPPAGHVSGGWADEMPQTIVVVGR